MKAFLVGFIFLIAVGIFAGISVLLWPLVMVMAFFLRIFISFAFIIFAIWALGKLIIYIWENLSK